MPRQLNPTPGAPFSTALRQIRRPTGFTLIELLVVITLIVLLVALLLPGLAGAIRNERSTSCQSNQHQIYIAFMAWKTGVINPPPGNPHFVAADQWSGQIVSYAGNNQKILACSQNVYDLASGAIPPNATLGSTPVPAAYLHINSIPGLPATTGYNVPLMAGQYQSINHRPNGWSLGQPQVPHPQPDLVPVPPAPSYILYIEDSRPGQIDHDMDFADGIFQVDPLPNGGVRLTRLQRGNGGVNHFQLYDSNDNLILPSGDPMGDWPIGAATSDDPASGTPGKPFVYANSPTSYGMNGLIGDTNLGLTQDLPANAILLLDYYQPIASLALPNTLDNWSADANGQALSIFPRHNKRFNALYADGSVKTNHNPALMIPDGLVAGNSGTYYGQRP